MKNNPAVILAAVIAIALTGITIFYGFFRSDQDQFKAQWQKRDQTLEQYEAQLKDLVSQMQKTKGDLNCNSDSQCKTIGLGSKVCGYEKDYLIYSIKNADEPELLRLVNEFNKVHEKLNALTLTASKCGTKPLTVYCIAHQCTINR